jgi:HSP20 family molecular chaperone IbpA
MPRSNTRSTGRGRGHESRGSSSASDSRRGEQRAQRAKRAERTPNDRSVATRGGAGAPERSSSAFAPGLWPGEYWFPQIEVFQRGDDFVVRADLPGMERENVTVEVTDDALTIHGERRSEREESDRGVYRSERSYGSFHRRIGLPDGVDAETAKAQFKNGVLEVTMRTTTPATERGRRIDVEGDDRGRT